MIFMDKGTSTPIMAQNQTPKKEVYPRSSFLGEDFGVFFPVGLVLVSQQNKIVTANPELEDLFDIPEGSLTGKSDQDFFRLLLSLVQDPDYVQSALIEAVQNIDKWPVIKLDLRSESQKQLEIIIFPTKFAEKPASEWGGLIIDRSVEKLVYNRQVNMLREMSKETRKISAGVQGNINALSGNIQTWTKEISEDFLSDINDQIGILNDKLDQILNFIHIFDRIPIYPESVGVWDLVNKIIKKNKGLNSRVISRSSDVSDLLSIKVDPALTSLIIEYILVEMLQHIPTVNEVEIICDDLGDTVRIAFQGGIIQPLSDQAEMGEENPRLYLIRQLVNVQGGELKVLSSLTERNSGLYIEVILPGSISMDDQRKSSRNSVQEQTQTGRILVADSQPEYQALLLRELGEIGYRVDLAVEGSAALDMVQVINPDLVVIDRNLAGLDGLMVTQGIRRWSAVPILMVSSKSNPDDLIQAFQAGVDDFVYKPFQLDEILVRIEANIRRGRESSPAFAPDVFSSGEVRINYSTRQVWLRGKLIELTPIEYNLLLYMSQHRKQIMPYEQIIERAWEGPEKGSRQGLFVHIRRLRKKIEDDPKDPRLIQNKWGVGYIFSP
jgi:two-component system KDP operon response regulator KdpE